MMFFTNKQRLEDAKQHVILTGSRLFHAKIRHMEAQEQVYQAKRKHINDFMSWLEKADDMAAPEHAEKVRYNQNLLRRYFGSEEQLQLEIQHLKFDIRTRYLDYLKDTVRQFRMLNEAGHMTSDLHYGLFFVDILTFNHDHHADLNEDALQREEADFRAALLHMNQFQPKGSMSQTFSSEVFNALFVSPLEPSLAVIARHMPT